MLDRPVTGGVCDQCWSACTRFTAPLCGRCGLPLPSWRLLSLSAGTCAACRRAPGQVTLSRAFGPHEGALREIIHAFKYRGMPSLASPLAARMREAGADVLAGAQVAVPVPLHPRREWQRGFNQAELLAGGLGLPVRRVLSRVVATKPQAALAAPQRRRNVERAFRLARVPWARGLAAWVNVIVRPAPSVAEREIAGRVLVLVDDVSTTGATLESCARRLVQAGAREVRALTAARAVLVRR